MKQNVLDLINKINHTCEGLCVSSSTNIHGLHHLCRVAYLAGRFAASMHTCVESAVVGGYLHDCARQDDGDGNAHAHDSANLACQIMKSYYFHLDIERICSGIYCHADGTTTADPLIGCIWDADRIDLTRLGIEVNEEFLSTDIGKRFCRTYRIKNQKPRNVRLFLD